MTGLLHFGSYIPTHPPNMPDERIWECPECNFFTNENHSEHRHVMCFCCTRKWTTNADLPECRGDDRPDGFCGHDNKACEKLSNHIQQLAVTENPDGSFLTGIKFLQPKKTWSESLESCQKTLSENLRSCLEFLRSTAHWLDATLLSFPI
ncbi:unnamed protein product [Amoebophrya sp. A25]|nr:unnamed protein product [Amoebophrya sp. A25]|eukprot:GSA25T00016433001.1